MNNTLEDLNNYLFESIERLNDDGMTEDVIHQITHFLFPIFQSN